MAMLLGPCALLIQPTARPATVVSVVGAGPVGLMLTLWLAEQGTSVRLYEPRAAFDRPQIVYMEMTYWKRVPLVVKEALKIHGGLCYYNDHPLVCNDTTGTYINIQLGPFQTHLSNYLRTTYPHRVHFVPGLALFRSLCPHTSFRVHDEAKRRDVVERNERAHAEHMKHQHWVNQEEDRRRRLRLSRPPPLPLPSSPPPPPPPLMHLVLVSDGGGKGSLVHDLWEASTGDRLHGVYQHIPLAFAAVVTFCADVLPGPLNIDAASATNKQRAYVTWRVLPNLCYIGLKISEASFRILSSTSPGLPDASRLEQFRSLPEGRLFDEIVAQSGYMNMSDISFRSFPIQLQTAKQFYFPLAHAGHFFLVGDAAFTTDFFSGTGMNRGLATAERLLETICEKPVAQWVRYNADVGAIRDALWDRVIPTYLANVEDLQSRCRGDSRCIIESSRTQLDTETAADIHERRYSTKPLLHGSCLLTTRK